MFTTALKRIFRSGFVNFWRNGFVTLASVLVMTITLFILGSLLFVNAMLHASLDQIQDKVDVNVYFTTTAPEADILALKDKLEAQPSVSAVEYVSREQAIEDFKQLHKDDELILQALDELDENPLGAYFNIRATQTQDYEAIANFLQSDQALGTGGTKIVDNVNYFRNKEAIDRLGGIISSINTLSFAVMIVFILISLLIVFNTIRLAIYTAREEISVMKLVGASNWYVRGPFIIEGVMYGVVAAIFSLILFYPITLWIGPSTEIFFGTGGNLFDYFVDNFAQLFMILVLTGAVLGALSSYLAVKKYLRV